MFPPLRAVVAVTAALALILALPDAAHAHGVSGTADSAGAFLNLGFRHMLLGWDHLLFIGGILLLAANAERAMKLLSVFALGHSTTLIAATVAGWQVNPVLVDIVIALSLAFVGLVGWLGPPSRWRLFGAGVLLFGLVHGLGLATRLQEPALAEHVTVWRVVAFNVGVEIAQLFGTGMALLAGLAAWHYLRRVLSWPATWRLAHAALITIGLVTGAVLAGSAGQPAASVAGTAAPIVGWTVVSAVGSR
jgi:hydrogenase/urease accessory protein HupE